MNGQDHYGVDLKLLSEGLMTFEQFLETWRSFSNEEPEGVQRQRALSWIRSIPKLSLSWSALPNGHNAHQAILMFLLRLVDHTHKGSHGRFGDCAFRAAGLMVGGDNKMRAMLHNLPAWAAIQIVAMIRRTRTHFPGNEWNKTHNNLTELVKHIYSLACKIGPKVGDQHLAAPWLEPHAAVQQQVLRLCVFDQPHNRNDWIALIENMPSVDNCFFLAQAIVKAAIEAPGGKDLPPISSQQLLDDRKCRVDLYDILNSTMHFKLFGWLEYLNRIIHLRDLVPLARSTA